MAQKRLVERGQKVTLYHEKDRSGGFYSLVDRNGKVLYCVMYLSAPKDPKMANCTQDVALKHVRAFATKHEMMIRNDKS